MKSFVFAAALLLLAFTSQFASASFMERCDFEADVKAVQSIGKLGESVSSTGAGETTYTRIMTVMIVNADTAECNRHVGQLKTIVLDSASTIKENDQLALSYMYVKSMTPTGVASMTSWTLAP